MAFRIFSSMFKIPSVSLKTPLTAPTKPSSIRVFFQVSRCWSTQTSAKSSNLTFHIRDGNSTRSIRLNMGAVLRKFYCTQGQAPSRGIPKKPKSDTTPLYYVAAVWVLMIGVGYAGVPLYRMFCQSAGLGGQATQGHDTSMVETMVPVKDRQIRIRFTADTVASMQWRFRPQQTEITVTPGETALAFYTATNPTDKPIIGISTYNVVPYTAGAYFNKIQCFCFEEQRLNPHEQVDMPVFFFIDPSYNEDPKLEDVDDIVLSYTFFEARDGLELPQPAFMR